MKSRALAVVVLSLSSLVSSAANAQDAYPSKAITMINPFPPGGVVDVVGRPLAAIMEKTLKQPVVMVNRPGAGGAVGFASAAKAPPDGYTILMGLSSISIFPVSDRINGKLPSYELKDFAPIALVTAHHEHRRVRTRPSRTSSTPPRRIRARSIIRPPAYTARCTWRWRSSPMLRESSCSTCPTRAAARR